MTYQIFADNLIEALWFKGLSPILKDSAYKKIGPRKSNPPAVEELIRYDRPDIILLENEKPVLVVEKTREVPTGHNVGQRIARLVRAVESGIPTIKFFPFDARKHGDFTSICNLNARLIAAFFRMKEIHGVPILAVNWTADDHGELIDDGSEDDRMKAIVHDYLSSGHAHDSAEIVRQLAAMQDEYRNRVRRFPKYAEYPGDSVRALDTDDLLRRVKGHVEPKALLGAFKHRANSMLYVMKMTPRACRREDPYTGTQFIYDYLWCRSGADPGAKHTNLVLQFPLISRNVWYAANPNDAGRKSCNWYLTASALWFSDGLDLLR